MANRFKVYSKYKDSGVEWLREVPESWEILRLKSLLNDPLKYGANELGESEDPILPRYIRITDIDENNILRTESMKSLALEKAQDFLLEEGDLLFARSGATAGKTFLYRSDWGKCAYAGYLIRARIRSDKALSKFLRYFTDSGNYWSWIKSIYIQSTIQNISAEKYSNISIAIPPLVDQQTIISFLDRETSRIDTLVSEQHHLIDLLKEKRQALISHAVTKGLDPNVKMKDSGVEWLGEVPEHWEVKRIKFAIATSRNGIWGDDPTGNDDTPCVRVADFNRDTLRVNAEIPTLRSISEKDRCGRLLRQGNLLLEKSGGGDKQPVGQVVLYDRDSDAVCSNFIAKIDLAPGEIPSFWCYQFASVYSCGLNLRSIKQTSGIQNLDQEQYFDELVPHPPISEQLAISSFLDRETSRIDTLISETERAIELLKEHRQSLISAAVTGKIDVREEMKNAVEVSQ